MALAQWQRLLQFRSGPRASTFYACDVCKPQLEHVTLTSHYASSQWPIRPVEEADEVTCDFCREP